MNDKTIIFDFDGTLADTFSLVVDVSYEIAGNSKRLPPGQIEPLRQLPLLKAVRALGISWWQIPKLTLLTRRRMFSRIREVPVFPGVAEALHGLDMAGYKMCVLTSNHRRNAQSMLRAHGLEQYFSDIVSVPYGNVFFKIYGLRKLVHRNHLKAENCFYVGNEVLDLHAAERSGMRAIATTWGGHDREELAATEPFAIIDKPEELLGLIQK
jgi:phosphoglycolate phosphatase-like HAD superfamily hydrolase